MATEPAAVHSPDQKAIGDGRSKPSPRLPRLLVADAGLMGLTMPPGVDAGVLLRDIDLPALVDRARAGSARPAVDLDTVRGLGTDDAAVDFVVRRLGIRIVLTRRPQAASRAAELGALGLVHALAFDSTGLSRSLDGHPRTAGVGTVISPGLVLIHMNPSELERLPRPVLAYGLISSVSDARRCLDLADGIVLRPALAVSLATATLAEPAGANPLTMP
jgi:glycerol-3-phosphate responsive antiterminator